MNNSEIATRGESLQPLMRDLRQITEQARSHVAATANYALSMIIGMSASESIAKCLEMSARSMVNKLSHL